MPLSTKTKELARQLYVAAFSSDTSLGDYDPASLDLPCRALATVCISAAISYEKIEEMVDSGAESV